MYIDEVFEKEMFPALKEYLKTNSKYDPKLVKVYTQESKLFPIVTIMVIKSNNSYNTLTYGEETEDFTIELNVYSNDKEKTSKRTICNEITDLIVKWFKSEYHLSIVVKKDIQNIDVSIQRNLIQVSGTLDTKNGEDNLIIYPTLKTNHFN